MLSTAALVGLAMQCAASVHPDTVKDVARTESSFNPLAIGVVGGSPLYPSSVEDAVKQVSRLKASGKNYSVGLMQINQSNFSRYGVTARQLFDPCNNLAVFEKLITDCYQRGGTLKRALSCYYSGNFITGQKPERDFSQTTYVQRIGYNPGEKYAVPGTRDDIEKEQSDPPPPPPSGAPPVYESWDVLREYPRPAAPPASSPPPEQQKESKAPADTPETRTG